MSDFGYYDDDSMSLGETADGSPFVAYRPHMEEEVLEEGLRSQFTIDPLEPGFGYTLGNSLRRTLLSSIPGASVTSIKIDSVLHEFSTIEGVKEDVTELILNLKGLVVSSEHDEPVTLYLRKSGAGDVTAADIAPPAGVEVHNPDLRIATAYVLPLGGTGQEDVLHLLARNKGELRRMIGKKVGLKFTPDLRFRIDETFDRLDETRRLFSQDDVRRDVGTDEQDDP